MTSESLSALKSFVIISVLLVLIVGLVRLVKCVWPLQPPIDISKTAILISDTCIQASQSEIVSHNAIIRDFLIQLMNIENAHAVARESSRTQMRGFYMGILAALLVFLIRSYDIPQASRTKLDPSESKFVHYSKRHIPYIILAIIAVFYILEVYEDDLHKRYYSTYYIYSDAVMQLTSSAPSAKTWRSFNYINVKNAMDQASADCARWPRLLQSLIQPGGDQTLLYILPVIALIVLRVREHPILGSHKNRRTSP